MADFRSLKQKRTQDPHSFRSAISHCYDCARVATINSVLVNTDRCESAVTFIKRCCNIYWQYDIVIVNKMYWKVIGHHSIALSVYCNKITIAVIVKERTNDSKE